MIDTHAHLNFKAFKNILRETILKANQSGVKKIIVPGASLDSSTKAVEITGKYNDIYSAVGIHPFHAIKELEKSDIKILKKKIKELTSNKKVVAIGECGLDYYYIKNQVPSTQPASRYIGKALLAGKYQKEIKKTQKEIFKMQIKLASELNLPLIIHNRDADDDILNIFENCPPEADQPWADKLKIENLCGVFHCFQASFELLNWVLNHNFYIGITGLVTYDKYMQSIVEKTPLENILIETDSPYLRPRLPNLSLNFPNTPVNVKIVAKTVAFIKKKSIEEVINKTTQNANSLFRLD